MEKYYSDRKPSEKDKKELYERNKDVFFKEFRTIKYAVISPDKITGVKEYNESFFKELDIIENNLLDGQTFDETEEIYNLKINLINKLNANKENEKKIKIETLPDNLFKKIYNLKKIKSPQIFTEDNKYFIGEVSNIEKKNKSYNDPEVQEALNAQINFKDKIESNTSIIKDISMGAYNKEKFKQFALDNNLIIQDYTIKNLKQNEIFSEGLIKRIFLTKDGEVDLITNNTLTKSFLVLIIKTEYKTLKNESNEYEKYEAKARLNLINKIYQSNDNNLNMKYNVELNKRTIERVKNSF